MTSRFARFRVSLVAGVFCLPLLAGAAQAGSSLSLIRNTEESEYRLYVEPEKQKPKGGWCKGDFQPKDLFLLKYKTADGNTYNYPQAFYVNPKCTDTCDGSTYAKGFVRIKQAIEAAKFLNNCARIRVILIAAGTYTRDSEGIEKSTSVVNLSGLRNFALVGGVTGDVFEIDDNWGKDAAAKSTVFDGKESSKHVIFVNNSDVYDSVNGELRNIAVRGGAGGETGGGILFKFNPSVEDENFALRNINVIANSATKQGGGIRVINGSLSILEGSRIENNSAENGGGVSAKNSEIKIDYTTIWRNRAKNGGGLYFDQDKLENKGAKFKITHSKITKNVAESRGKFDKFKNGGFGGAVFSNGVFGTFSGCFIEENNAGNSGGGIYVKKADLELERSCLQANSAKKEGSALSLDCSELNTKCKLKASKVEIRENFGSYTYGAVSLKNAKFDARGGLTFEGNKTNGAGGALALDHSYMEVGNEEVLFVNNSAKIKGGAIHKFFSEIDDLGSSIVYRDNRGASEADKNIYSFNGDYGFFEGFES